MTKSIQRPFRPTQLGEGDSATFSALEMANDLVQEDSYKKAGKNAVTLLQSDELTLVLVVLKKGTEIEAHQTPGPAAATVLRGEAAFRFPDGVKVVGPGETAAFAAKARHAVIANQDSALLIAIGGKNDYANKLVPHAPIHISAGTQAA